MIPKTIHYCWFGRSPKPQLAEKCINSWKKYCPEYEIKEWNEDNFDVNCTHFTRNAYRDKKWAFLSDYVRLWIVYHYGGIYLDTDVELLKPLDFLLEYDAWFAMENSSINTGLGFGSTAGNHIVYQNMKLYDTLSFDNNNIFEVSPCPYYTTSVFKEHGYNPQGSSNELILLDGVIILPDSYCNPFDWTTKKLKISPRTISIHHYAASWQSEEAKRNNLERHLYHKYEKRYGKTVAKLWSLYFWSQKTNGGDGFLRAVAKLFLRKIRIKRN